ncbi:MAG: hypothetical protein JW932_07070 [Deltaproteobacteria bacterium]|nr:hypothetical protein [Deltaproteobacteria bacterium]
MNTGKVVWPQIVEALTKPITKEEIAEKTGKYREAPQDPREIVFTGTMDEVNQYFSKKHWSDGLPIVPPTIEKVNEFLKYTDHPWDETIAVLQAAYRDTKVWHIAVNGVMAGCPPEYMPLLIAYIEAIPDKKVRMNYDSTHGWIPYAWINGPVARQLGIDCGQGMITEPQNMVLGRFLSLAVQNLSGYYIKENRMGTFGYPMSWAFAEDEEACRKIGWDPYHVQKGFDLNQSTLTASTSLVYGNNLIPATDDPQKIMELIAWDFVEKQKFAVGSCFPRFNQNFRTLMVTEYIARDLAWKYKTKEALETDLMATARRTVHERAFASYYAHPGSRPPYPFPQHVQRTIKDTLEQAEKTKLPPWYPDDFPSEVWTVPVIWHKGDTAIVVTGDRSRNKSLTLNGAGHATVEIKLPANWDELMEKAGYRPLKEFFLK